MGTGEPFAHPTADEDFRHITTQQLAPLPSSISVQTLPTASALSISDKRQPAVFQSIESPENLALQKFAHQTAALL